MGNKIKNFFVEIWNRINSVDIPDGYENLTKEERAELDNTYQVEKKVHEQKSFVPKAQINEGKAQASARGKAQNKGNSQIVRGNA